MLETGIKYTSYLTVSDKDTAENLGSGDLPVLSTPKMVLLMENAAMLCVKPYLPPEETTVGGHISVSHISPTSIGETVSATATLAKIEGKKLTFDVVAREDDKLIGHGTHIRFIVDRDKFRAKAIGNKSGNKSAGE